MINVDGIATRYSAFDFSSTGISVYNNLEEGGGTIPPQRATIGTNIRTNNWKIKSGLATEMLGNIDVTNNGGKLTVGMELPSAGCTVVGKVMWIPAKPLSKLTFTGFEKCKFAIDDDAGWSQADYKNTEGLAKVKGTAIAYVARI